MKKKIQNIIITRYLNVITNPTYFAGAGFFRRINTHNNNRKPPVKKTPQDILLEKIKVYMEALAKRDVYLEGRILELEDVVTQLYLEYLGIGYYIYFLIGWLSVLTLFLLWLLYMIRNL